MQLRLQLARIMILNLLNLYSLIWALFGKIDRMTVRIGQIKKSQESNSTDTPSGALPHLTTKSPTTVTPPEDVTEFSDIYDENTTEFGPTEMYDYGNTNYFEPEYELELKTTPVESSSSVPFFNFTDLFTDFPTNLTDLLYIDSDYGNLTDLYTNSTDDLLINSNFNMSNLISSFNSSTSFNGTATNYTNIEPIFSAYQSESFGVPQHELSSFIDMELLNTTTKIELRKLCWETMFGQELVKLTVMDLVSDAELK